MTTGIDGWISATGGGLLVTGTGIGVGRTSGLTIGSIALTGSGGRIAGVWKIGLGAGTITTGLGLGLSSGAGVITAGVGNLMGTGIGAGVLIGAGIGAVEGVGIGVSLIAT